MAVTDRVTTNGAQKAAILLSLMSEEDAAPILRNLPEGDLQRLTDEVSNLPSVPVEVTMQVLEEYRELMATQEYRAMGGQDRAVRMLTKAFGENNAKSLVQKFANGDENEQFTVASLAKTEPQQLARFLAGEHGQTQALIIGHMEPKQASALLMKLDPEARAECVKRLATMKRFSPDAAAKASRVLRRRFGGSGDQSRRSDTGFKNLADVMNRLDAGTAKQILETIETDEPNLAINIRDMMFTFENFLEVPEPDLRELMNSVDKKTLMVALKGASEDLRSHIYRTMSSRAVEIMKEDSEMMGPVRGKDVAKAQGEIVAIARKLESEGKIVLKSNGDDEYVL
ncbi:MAG TPA: flagellar motor switch protein FliG [Terracidiphilus sp.]